jgi:hypothetical protein
VADAVGIEQRLQEGALRARSVAAPYLEKLREAVGVGRLGPGVTALLGVRSVKNKLT